MILLWGLPRDGPMAAVRDALHHAGQPLMFLDQRMILETAVELLVSNEVEGRLRVANREVDLGEVRAVYLRPHDSRRLPAVARAGEGSPAWAYALEVEDCLMSWTELTRGLVVNRPSAMAGNGSKPYQAVQIQAAGFAVPATLLTTDPYAARRFWEQQGEVIYKSVSGVRSIVSRLTPAHRTRLDQVAWCPTQFQQYVPGLDYRVHVVGEELFACEIHSQADDYRYAGRQGRSVDIRSCDLPPDCAEQCRAIAAVMGLAVAGIDLRRTPEGEWYCFEVNPSPGFTYYQDATGQPIAAAVARLLIRAERNELRLTKGPF